MNAPGVAEFVKAQAALHQDQGILDQQLAVPLPGFLAKADFDASAAIVEYHIDARTATAQFEQQPGGADGAGFSPAWALPAHWPRLGCQIADARAHELWQIALQARDRVATQKQAQRFALARQALRLAPFGHHAAEWHHGRSGAGRQAEKIVLAGSGAARLLLAGLHGHTQALHQQRAIVTEAIA